MLRRTLARSYASATPCFPHCSSLAPLSRPACRVTSFPPRTTLPRLSRPPAFRVTRPLFTSPRRHEDLRPDEAPRPKLSKKDLYENIYTIPNALTISRMLACPFIGYYVVQSEFAKASALLFVAGVSDLVDGFLARRYGMGSVIGSVLDPAADKLLMTTMVVTLAIQGMMPVWLAALILGRDVALSISAFYFRYISLPPPKTFKRFWDFSIPSAQAVPTQISKYNTFLQLVLVGAMTVAPLVDMSDSPYLQYLQWIVAATTVASGASYLKKGGVKFVKQ